MRLPAAWRRRSPNLAGACQSSRRLSIGSIRGAVAWASHRVIFHTGVGPPALLYASLWAFFPTASPPHWWHWVAALVCREILLGVRLGCAQDPAEEPWCGLCCREASALRKKCQRCFFIFFPRTFLRLQVIVPSPPYSGLPSHLPLTPAPARVGGWARWVEWPWRQPAAPPGAARPHHTHRPSPGAAPDIAKARWAATASIPVHLWMLACRAAARNLAGTPRAFAFASWRTNPSASCPIRPPTSTPRTTSLHRLAARSSGYTARLLRLASVCKARPGSRSAPGLGSPLRVRGHTNVVSTATWAPCQSGSPFANTSIRRESASGKPTFMSRRNTLVQHVRWLRGTCVQQPAPRARHAPPAPLRWGKPHGGRPMDPAVPRTRA